MPASTIPIFVKNFMPRRTCLVSRETVRRILRGAKLASPQKRRPRQYRSRRLPRPRLGMMALADASRHDWLQGRGPQLTLLGFQDDATSNILAAHFQLEPDNTLGYLRALHTMIPTHGIPLSLYRDRHSIFQRNDSHWTLAEQLAGKQAPTQLGRALEELGIQQIPAYSPQAKGRIERAWRTFQDRLVSELRLAQTTTLAQANVVLARPPRRRLGSRLPLLAPPLRSGPLLGLALSTRRRSRSCHHLGRALHSPPAFGYAGETVELSHQLDGTLRVYRGNHLLLALPLPMEEDAGRRTAPITSAKKRKTPIPRI